MGVFLKIPIRKSILAWIWAWWLFGCPRFSCSILGLHSPSLPEHPTRCFPRFGDKSKNPTFLPGCSVASQGNSQQSAKSGIPLITHLIALLVEHPWGCSLGLLHRAAVKTRNEGFGVKPRVFRPPSIPVAQPPGSQG